LTGKDIGEICWTENRRKYPRRSRFFPCANRLGRTMTHLSPDLPIRYPNSDCGKVYFRGLQQGVCPFIISPTLSPA